MVYVQKLLLSTNQKTYSLINSCGIFYILKTKIKDIIYKNIQFNIFMKLTTAFKTIKN